MDTSLFGVIVIGLVTLFSIVLHEVAHGYVAYLFKDKTAFLSGRLTLNPFPHMDIIGSVIVPLASYFLSGTLFGWAKPVPVNTRNLVGRYADFWVSAAGVLTNLALASIAFVIAYFLMSTGNITKEIGQVLYTVIIVNTSLFLFNLIPIPPFDGMAILQGLFPKLRIQSAFIYSPFYMIISLVVASYLYSYLAPSVFRFILGSL